MKNVIVSLIIVLICNSSLTACSSEPKNSSVFFVPEYSKKEKRAVHAEITTPDGKPREDLKNTITWLRDCQVLREQAMVGVE
jgi:hypothetical protein